MAARVFMLKVDHFMDLIKNKHILGKVIAYVYIIEFQKRGKGFLTLLSLDFTF